VLLAAVILGLGTGFHLMAGGGLPGGFTFALLVALTVTVTTRLVHHPASSRRIIAIAVGGQAAVHAFLTATAGHGHDHASAASATPGATDALGAAGSGWAPGSLGAALAAPNVVGQSPDPIAVAAGRLAADLTPEHLPMALAHAVAAVLVGAWLARGETALLTLLALAAPRILPRPAPLIRPLPHLRVATPTVAIPDSLLALSSPGRRGPPVVAGI
jgi:hypothetical protein